MVRTKLWVDPFFGHSAFVPLQIANIAGTKLDGTVVGNTLGQGGQVVVIGPEPLLQSWIATNGHRMLTLYGNPGTNYQFLFSTNLVSTNWQAGQSTALSNLFQFYNADPTAPQIYYRAH
jgi:hypothetical protein